MERYDYAAFSGYGIEIEHMLVDAGTLDVVPAAGTLLDLVGGAEDMDVERGEAAWSNELALHVIEMKTAGPVSHLERAAAVFRQQVQELSSLLCPLGVRLMPTGMHPWMNPLAETKLWPHQNNVIYQAFDRIFDCHGHGWSNVQSTHINFPFSTEEEFVLVHAACRFVLPLLPALAASSPFSDGRRNDSLDARLTFYESNCARVPSITGGVIPEVIRSEKDYLDLLAGIYRDLAPFDPDGILAEEWVNARGAIARFERGAIEIRLLDAQECPEQDLALVSLVTALVQALAAGEFMGKTDLIEWPSWDLRSVYLRLRQGASSCPIGSDVYARALGGHAAAPARELVRSLVSRFIPESSPFHPGLALVCSEGTLAERLVKRLPKAEPTRTELHSLYLEVCDCLEKGQLFCP